MFKKVFYKTLRKNKVFKIGNSVLFAVQIPDDSVGCSGSRCSNCNSKAAYCHQICRQCKLPFIGPFGFPQLPDWESLTLDEKSTMVEEVYCHHSHRGRIEYVNVDFVPLTSDELNEVEKLQHRDARFFLLTHEVAPQKIRENLLF